MGSSPGTRSVGTTLYTQVEHATSATCRSPKPRECASVKVTSYISSKTNKILKNHPSKNHDVKNKKMGHQISVFEPQSNGQSFHRQLIPKLLNLKRMGQP